MILHIIIHYYNLNLIKKYPEYQLKLNENINSYSESKAATLST